MSRILFVDDDPAMIRTFQRLFAPPDFHVDGATDGAAALPLLELGDYDVLVADYQMPIMNGAELLAHARSRWPHTVRVLVTGVNDFRTAVDAVNRGEVFRILRKPWDEAELRFSIRLALELRQLHRDREALQQMLAEKTFALQHAHARLSELNQGLELAVHRRTTNLLDALSAALDMRDNETELHSRRVAAFARRLAEELGLDDAERRVVEQGALLHDVGKIGVPDSVLLKPGPLDEQEWTLTRRHPGIGYDLLRGADFLEGARQIIVQHQERFDGSGYPLGLKGDGICIGARIFAVVDTYDAITSNRPYRKAQSHDVAAAEIRRCAGSQLDPSVVEAFLRLPAEEWDRIRGDVAQSALQEAA